MNSVCGDCPHPSFCRYNGSCAPTPKHGGTVASASFVDASDDVRKATPIDAIFKFWPDAMVALAQHIWNGNEKYNPEHPKIGWIREKSSDHVGSMTRHLCYDYVKATTKRAKIKVMSAIAWRALAELQLLTEEKDDE
jgi:hypothetical protein